MAHGALGRDVLRLIERPAAERPAGAGEQDAPELALIAPRHGLKDRRMFGIDREDLRAAARRLRHDDFARAHERFLVCERDAPLLMNGGKRRAKAHAAGNAGHDAVRPIDRGGGDKGLLPFADLDIRVRKAPPELLCRGGVHNGDILRMELPRLLLEPVHIPPRRKREHGNTKTAGCLSSLPSDGAGGTQNGNCFHHKMIRPYAEIAGRSSIHSSVSGAR